MDSLNASSKLISNIESKDVIVSKESINISTDKKYLFISFCSNIREKIKWYKNCKIYKCYLKQISSGKNYKQKT